LRVIGLTGAPSVGKGEVVKFVRAWAEARGWQVGYLSFSDQIKEEARSRGIPEAVFTRELLSDVVTQMRAAEGPAVLARRIVARIRGLAQQQCPELFVVEAVRHVDEIALLRESFGSRFVVLGVTADPDVIADRLLARRRPDESREAMQGRENARAMILRELRGEAAARGVNVGACLEQADALIENNGTLESLRQAVMKALEEHKPLANAQ